MNYQPTYILWTYELVIISYDRSIAFHSILSIIKHVTYHTIPSDLCKHLKVSKGGMKLTMDWLSKRETSEIRKMWGCEASREGARPRRSWTWTHMNKLDESSRTSSTLGTPSAQKERKEIEKNNVFDAYMWWRLITMVLEHFLLAWSSLEPRKYEDGMKILGRNVCVFLVCSWCIGGRESEREWVRVVGV